MDKKILIAISGITIFSLIFWSKVGKILWQKTYYLETRSPSQKFLELKPDVDEYRLDGELTSIEHFQGFSEIEINLVLKTEDIFLNISPEYLDSLKLTKKIIVFPSVPILEGKLFQENTKELKGLDGLKKGDLLIIKTAESIKELPFREKFSARWIKRVVLE